MGKRTPIESKEMLINICKENNIKLKKSYEVVTNATIIVAECYIEGCNNDMVEKCFKSFMKYKNFGCKEHAHEISQSRRKTTDDQNKIDHPEKAKIRQDKYENTNMVRYGCPYPLQNKDIQLKSINTSLKIYGCEYPIQNSEVQLKTCNTNLKRYGFKNPFQNPEVQQKIRDTNMDRYDCVYPTQNPEVQLKTCNTNLKIYGFKRPSQNPEVKQKISDTHMDRYDCEYPSQHPNAQLKACATNLKKYGCENPMQNHDVQLKTHNTVLERYGVDHVMQDPVIAKRAADNAFKFKEYTYPSSRVDKVQGYEPRALDNLLYEEKIHEDDIITSRIEVPEIWWTDDQNKQHRYYVDIFIKSQNRCIEIKSDWTFGKKTDTIFLKQQAVKDAGYESEIWVYDHKKLIETYY